MTKYNKLGNKTSKEEKEVVGASGTPFPNREKNNILITYVLDGVHIYHTSDFRKNVEMKMRSRYDGISARFKKSGSSSKASFKNQALILKIKGDQLPVRGELIERGKGVIERAQENVEVVDIIIDQP
jgi:hypothetical protein